MGQLNIPDRLLEQLVSLASSHGQTVEDYIASIIPQTPAPVIESDVFYRALFDKIASPVLVIDRENRYVAVNDAACDYLGYPRDEFLSLHPRDIIAETEDRQEYIRMMWGNTGYARSIYRLKHKNGDYIFADVIAIANVMPGYHVAVMYDATENIFLVEALIESQQVVDSIFEETGIPMFSLAVNGNGNFSFRNASQAYWSSLGVRSLDVTGIPLDELSNWTNAYLSTLIQEATTCCEAGRTTRFDIHFQQNGGNIHWRTRLMPLRDETGQIHRILGVCVDLTEQLAYEEERLRAYTLDTELAKAQELSRYKAEVTSMIAHEFQTPLSVINTTAYLIQQSLERGIKANHHARIERITGQVNRLQTLMRQVIDINHSTVMSEDLNLSEIHFVKFVNGIASDVLLSFPEQAKIVMNCQIENPLIVTDPELMRRIVSNLISNALKYSDNFFLPVEINCYKDSKHFTLAVRDHGIGIPAEDLDSIFEFFKRGQNVEARAGIGIGMMVVKQAVTKLGGTVHIESEERIGTTVSVRLPSNAVLPQY